MHVDFIVECKTACCGAFSFIFLGKNDELFEIATRSCVQRCN